MQRTLTLMTRALRVDSRSLGPHLFRCALAIVVLLCLWTVSTSNSAAPGLDLFNFIVGANAVFISFASIGFFSSCITEEKEEQTLPLMQLANISGLSIVMGKYVPQLFSVILLLTAELPFTFLAISLGGLLPSQVWIGYVALLAHLVWMSSLGLLCSTISHRSQAAGMLCGALILLHIFGPDLAGFLIDGQKAHGPFPAHILAHCDRGIAAWKETSLFRNLGNLPTTVGGKQVVSNLGGGAIVCLLSILLFARFADDAPAVTRVSFLQRLKSKRASRRAGAYAISWREFYFQAGGLRKLLVRFVMGGLLNLFLIWGYYDPKTGSSNPLEIGEKLGFIMFGMLLLQIGMDVGRVFSTELREQTWAGMVLLPQPLGQTCVAKLWGIVPALVPYFFWWLVGITMAPWYGVFGESLISGLVVTQILLCYHFTALISVAWPRGGSLTSFILGVLSVLAGDLLVLVGIVTTGPGGALASEALLSLCLLASCLVMVGIWLAIGSQLREAASR